MRVLVVQETITPDLCEYDCCGGACDDGLLSKCGGEFGRVSVYYQVSAPVTIGLAVQLLNVNKENVAIVYDGSTMVAPPEVTYQAITTPAPTTTAASTVAGATNPPAATTTNATSTTSGAAATTTTVTTTTTTAAPAQGGATTTPSNMATVNVYNSYTEQEAVSTAWKKLNVMEVNKTRFSNIKYFVSSLWILLWTLESTDVKRTTTPPRASSIQMASAPSVIFQVPTLAHQSTTSLCHQSSSLSTSVTGLENRFGQGRSRGFSGLTSINFQDDTGFIFPVGFFQIERKIIIITVFFSCE